MNSASFLLCIVFAAIGYVIYPMILPKLVDSGVVSESALSDDYKKNVAEDDVDEETEVANGDVTTDPVVPIAPDAAPDVAPNVNMEPEVVVEEVVVEEVVPMPVVPTPAPAAEPAPEPTPEPEAPAVVELTDAQFSAILKNSVSAGEVNEFKMDQVADWKRSGQEVIAGETYDVGIVIYNAKTIFGEEKLQAKALVKDGKVEKWLWPTTNTEMR